MFLSSLDRTMVRWLAGTVATVWHKILISRIDLLNKSYHSMKAPSYLLQRRHYQKITFLKHNVKVKPKLLSIVSSYDCKMKFRSPITHYSTNCSFAILLLIERCVEGRNFVVLLYNCTTKKTHKWRRRYSPL